MSLESEYFKRSKPNFHKLEAFGFCEKSGLFKYNEKLLGGQFQAEIRVARDGAVSGTLVDLETGEEYLPIRFVNQVGEFVGEVREAYLKFLGKVKDECFEPLDYIYDQTNRIDRLINGKYGVSAEFPWENYPGNGTYKCLENDKWFAVILTVEYGKLDGAPETGSAKADEVINRKHDADKVVEVVNLKADPDEIPELIERAGVFKAWHMNKKHWISVVLDGTLPDEAVMELISKSHAMVSSGKASKVRSTGVWMIPSNPKIYDVDDGFKRGGGVIEWHQHNQIKAGDQVFIYCSAPYSAIIYRCEVLEADLPYRGMFKDSKGYEKSMKIRLVDKYEPDRYPLSFIKMHGGSVVRSARRMPEELFNAIK